MAAVVSSAARSDAYSASGWVAARRDWTSQPAASKPYRAPARKEAAASTRDGSSALANGTPAVMVRMGRLIVGPAAASGTSRGCAASSSNSVADHGSGRRVAAASSRLTTFRRGHGVTRAAQ